MQPKIFTPSYSLYTWSLLLLYAAPWLLGVANAFAGWTNTDWRLFFLLSASAWLVAGLLHLKSALLKRIRFSDAIVVEMRLQRPAAQPAARGVRVCGSIAHFECRDVRMKYLANAGELMQTLVAYAGRGELNLVYDQTEEKDKGWSAWKSLLCLGAFALYMALALWLGLRPVPLVGPATDALLPALALLAIAGVALWAVRAGRGKGARTTAKGTQRHG